MVCAYIFSLFQAPVGRVFFTGEHTSENFSGFVHGGYLTGREHVIYLLTDDVELWLNFTGKKEKLSLAPHRKTNNDVIFSNACFLIIKQV